MIALVLGSTVASGNSHALSNTRATNTIAKEFLPTHDCFALLLNERIMKSHNIIAHLKAQFMSISPLPVHLLVKSSVVIERHAFRWVCRRVFTKHLTQHTKNGNEG